jgi:hypothetical protein
VKRLAFGAFFLFNFHCRRDPSSFYLVSKVQGRMGKEFILLCSFDIIFLAEPQYNMLPYISPIGVGGKRCIMVQDRTCSFYIY